MSAIILSALVMLTKLVLTAGCVIFTSISHVEGLKQKTTRTSPKVIDPVGGGTDIPTRKLGLRACVF